MASPDTLARRAAQAKAQAAEAVALVADQSTALGLRLSDETGAANQSLADARRSADDTLEATAEAVGTLHATSREEESLVRRRVPLENRARSARDDLASDDDATLTRADEAARTSGRSGDGIAVTAWHAATTEARILGVGAADVTGEALPPRDAVTAFADAVRQASREANDEVAQLRIRVGELPSATADTDRDAELEKRALDTFRLAVRAAHDASTQAREALAGHLVQGFADAIHRAATIADDFVVAVSTDDAEALPTEHGAHEVADAFASAARLTHVDTAWRTIEDLIATEREADRARAVAQSDAETAWRTAAEAAVLLGVDIGDRPDDVGEFAPLSRLAGERLGVGVVGVATTRAMAVGAWEAVIADVGAATETIAAARRTLGDEAALPLAEALSRRDDARLDHRARERAATILTTTRSRMMAAILPDTQREMARLLPDLTAGRYRFPRLDERFQLEVFDERKRGWVRRSLFSGGTQDQFSLALRLGFAIAALPRELGTAPGFLFLDEPLSSFDRERTHALVDLLRDPTGIIGTHFRQIFLISHSQAFDPGLFTHHIEMEEGRVARTTLSATAPAVTA
jgi:hypothetical protein